MVDQHHQVVLNETDLCKLVEAERAQTEFAYGPTDILFPSFANIPNSFEIIL